MFTKAGKQAIQAMSVWTTVANQYNTIPMFPNSSVRNTTNAQRWISYVNGNLISTLNCVLNTNPGIHLGSGTVTPTENDYILTSQITSGISVIVSGIARGVDSSNRLYMELVLNVTNTSSSNITVSEVGLVSGNIQCCTSASATATQANNILLDHTLLDSPVTIAPSDTAAIKYRITSDMTFS